MLTSAKGPIQPATLRGKAVGRLDGAAFALERSTDPRRTARGVAESPFSTRRAHRPKGDEARYRPTTASTIDSTASKGARNSTLELVPRGQQPWWVVTHGDRSRPVLPDQHLEWKIQTGEGCREHDGRSHTRLPEHGEFRLGHLHTNSFSCAAVIDDPERREASLARHLASGLATATSRRQVT